MNIVSDILDNDKFLKLENYKHHGINRLEHSIRVSYYSYLVAKKLRLNYEETARGGLLHDFFINEDIEPKKQKLSIVFHPYSSLENACSNFNLSDLEKDIIINHMFPTLPHKVPKYMESWLVSCVDKGVAVYELTHSFQRTFLYKFSKIYLVLLLFR